MKEIKPEDVMTVEFERGNPFDCAEGDQFFVTLSTEIWNRVKARHKGVRRQRDLERKIQRFFLDLAFTYGEGEEREDAEDNLGLCEQQVLEWEVEDREVRRRDRLGKPVQLKVVE